MALPLIESGKYEVHLLANRQTSFADAYHTFGHWLEMGQLNNLIKLHAPDTDIFHVHNEPSHFVTLIKELCDVPVVLDVHDSFLARTSEEESKLILKDGENPIRYSVEERNNFQLADGLVFPAESFGELIKNEYKLNQPSIILRSHVPRRQYRYNAQDWLGGICYEGKTQIDTEMRGGHAFRYCDYKEFAKACFDAGIDFHIYGARDDSDFINAYKDIAIVHKPYVFDQMLKNIARHDWGFVGNLYPTSEWKYAMPNKLFEYVAASVPVVAMNAPECEEYVVKNCIGISVKSLDELKARWKEHREIRKTLVKNRINLCMEKNIQPLEELYDGLSRDKGASEIFIDEGSKYFANHMRSVTGDLRLHREYAGYRTETGGNGETCRCVGNGKKNE